jgi:hypothetical protein
VKNFDEQRSTLSEEERTFQIGGETFLARAKVRPEALAQWDGISGDMPALDILKASDETILALMDQRDNAHARYTALREREDDPLSLDDLVDLGQWLVEVVTGRPTEPLSGSTTSPSTPGTTPTGAPSSPESPEAQAA